MGGAIGVGVDATWDVDGDSFPRPPQEEAADARWHRRADRPGGDIEPHFAASRAASATSMERTSSPFRRKAAARLPRKDFNPLQIPTLETDKANYRALARWAGDGVWSTKEGCPSVSPFPPLRQSTGWPRSGVWTCRRHAASARRVACAWVIFVQACPDPSKRGRGNADSQITQPYR